jgi:glyoxylase-like metal-dependent hydrolase (beta-lactamase superfamily II)
MLVSSEIFYAYSAPPAPGEAIEAAPGVWWLRMPLPFKLNHINLWLLEDGEGFTLVDTGMNSPETRDIWEKNFISVLGGKPIKRVISTHFHPDHMGLAGWLCPRFGAELWASLGEWLYGRMLAQDGGLDYVDNHVEFYRKAGFSEDLLELLRQRGNSYASRVVVPPPSFRRIVDGEKISIGNRVWRAIEGNGHAPEHISLYCQEEGLLLSGDQILPKISPIVGVWTQEPEADPLHLFIASLKRFMELPADTLVLPSHGLPFRGVGTRAEELAHHHDGRLAETLAACATPITAYQLLRKLFTRELDQHEVFFACGESLAHLHYLMEEGRITREMNADGAHRYKTKA